MASGIMYCFQIRAGFLFRERSMSAWGHLEEQYSDCNIVGFDCYGGGSVKAWPGICLDEHTDLTLRPLRYWDEILQPVVWPFLGAVEENFNKMVQENAAPNSAQISLSFPWEEGINTMDWLISNWLFLQYAPCSFNWVLYLAEKM